MGPKDSLFSWHPGSSQQSTYIAHGQLLQRLLLQHEVFTFTSLSQHSKPLDVALAKYYKHIHSYNVLLHSGLQFWISTACLQWFACIFTLLLPTDVHILIGYLGNQETLADAAIFQQTSLCRQHTVPAFTIVNLKWGLEGVDEMVKGIKRCKVLVEKNKSWGCNVQRGDYS